MHALAAALCAVSLGAAPARNAVYVELVGSAPVVSLNYERGLGDGLTARLGVGYLRATGFLGSTLDRVQLPLLFGYLVGSGPHHLELGLGAVPGLLVGRGPGAGPPVEVP